MTDYSHEEFEQIMAGTLTGRGEAIICLIIAKHIQGNDVESIGRQVYEQYGRRLSVHHINAMVGLYERAIKEAV